MSENLVVDAAYRHLGGNIVEMQKSSQWGDKLLAQLSRDLMHAFPSMKGFSKRNLELIRQWYLFWEGDCEFAKQAVSQMMRQSDLANQLLKDPCVFDFIDETNVVDERDLEKSLIEHVTQFLLELGSGFAYIGKQVLVTVGERDFYLDLLFYHTKLHCYVVVELKMGEFEPEYAGKLNFYIKAVDEQLRGDTDAPTIGILLCKSKDRLVVDYALSDIHKPMGVSEYVLGNALPEHLKRLLPSSDDFELELQDVKKAAENRT
ncbi:DUF1016 family protein [Thiomicrospira microaerophila]|uniref:PDDEXK nuclease domain-containing protein n=1 Tax=Thiomicrospira microaerophila TaxID=406020 RepID=UPI00200FD8AF|nr:PDDEXK nuclease domain-containing protein [Thiomicrospira microaerophila]UQB43355.1 DUF1016 family protein [Thiomicrospira microaerophila]